jgi:predicted ribosome quality control (RQC) complex YloA/Tae2 family protein
MKARQFKSSKRNSLEHLSAKIEEKRQEQDKLLAEAKKAQEEDRDEEAELLWEELGLVEYDLSELESDREFLVAYDYDNFELDQSYEDWKGKRS